jgi:hypothetical protein
MPGYKALPDQYGGRVAQGVRYAEVLQRAGATDDAVQVLETALEMCTATSPEIPEWLCGRLAALYRVLKRVDDEVRLLERYRDSHQRSQDAGTRFDARLSKARAIADRQRRSDTRSLTSVQKAPNRITTDVPVAILVTDDDSDFPPGTRAMLRAAFLDAAASRDVGRLAPALLCLRDQARACGVPPERLVATIKSVWGDAVLPTGVDRAAWDALYRDALTQSLTLYFGEAEW